MSPFLPTRLPTGLLESLRLCRKGPSLFLIIRPRYMENYPVQIKKLGLQQETLDVAGGLLSYSLGLAMAIEIVAIGLVDVALPLCLPGTSWQFPWNYTIEKVKNYSLVQQ